jgi:hypothetical protein
VIRYLPLIALYFVVCWLLWRIYTVHRPKKRRRGYGPAWDRRRAAFYRTHPKVCHACGTGDGVHLHHIVLAFTRYPIGDEPDHELVPLCEEHHEQVHRWHRRIRCVQPWRWKDTRTATGLLIRWGRMRWSWIRDVPLREVA